MANRNPAFELEEKSVVTNILSIIFYADYCPANIVFINFRIVPFLKQGAGVLMTRAHVHYVITEYGIVDLYGKNISERAKELIAIAHPVHREGLERKAFELYG